MSGQNSATTKCVGKKRLMTSDFWAISAESSQPEKRKLIVCTKNNQ